MASSTTRLVTFREFEKLPEPAFGRLELHHGEVVEVAPPKHRHKLLQRRLRQLLEAASGVDRVVEPEFGYRPAREHEYWVADLAVVSKERWDAIPQDGYFEGAPELVIEVLSRSNKAAEIREKTRLSLQNGCREFWVVDPKKEQVEVFRAVGSATYKSGDNIPLFAANTVLHVREIFG